MPSGVNLKQTSHAVERWRQRVSPDEGPSHIALAFAGAVLVPKGDPLPFPRTPHTTYYRHATLADIYFVTQACNQGSGDVVLVTVTDASELWGVKRAFVPEVVLAPELPRPWSEPEHADAGARQAWLLAEWERAKVVQARCADLDRKHLVRQAWNDRRRVLEYQLAQCRKDLRAQHAEQLRAAAEDREREQGTPEAQAARFLAHLLKYQRNHTSTAQ